jgi:hypothetical protein
MEVKPLDSLVPDPKNPRYMKDHDAQALADGMDYFGDLSGIVFNAKLGKMVGGHQRIATIKKKFAGSRVVITQRFSPADETGTTALGYVDCRGKFFSYREVEWDEAKHYEANIAANRVSGDFDTELLAEVDQLIVDLGGDLSKTGQDEKELKLLLQASGAVPDDEKPDDGYRRRTLKFTEQQEEIVDRAISEMRRQRNLQMEGNDDMDANALYYMARSFLEGMSHNAETPAS